MNPYKEIFRKFFSEYAGTLRKRRGLTQEQMAEKLRITGRAYSDLDWVWETKREALRSITKYPLKREPLPLEFIAILAAYIKSGDAA